MNTTAPTRTKSPIKSIRITQVEGITGQLIDATVSTWAAAAIVLARICSTAPKDGSYYKCDFRCVWENKETYDGRFDASHPEYKNRDPADLAQQVRNFAEYLAGFRCPSHLDQATYEHQLAVGEKAKPGRGEEARKFLMNQSLKDDPTAKPATIEKNDRPRVMDVPAKVIPSTDILTRPVPQVPPAPTKVPIIPEMLRIIEVQLTVALAEMEKELARRLVLKTADRASDVAAYAKAKAQELELRKALAAVIKARS
jgi:hypothetical protein